MGAGALTPPLNVIPGDWSRLGQSVRGLGRAIEEAYSRAVSAAASTAGPQEGGYREIVGQPFPTSVVWYDSSSKGKKLVEVVVTRNSKQVPTTVVVKVYKVDGVTVDVTLTDTITYTNGGVFEQSRTRVVA